MDFTPSRRSTASLIAAASLLLTAGCDFEPTSATRHYALSESNASELADLPDVQAQVLGALEMLYGTPSDPQFMLTSDWLDDGYNPNWPQYPADDNGGGDFSDEELDALYADNASRFAEALALVESKEYEEVLGAYLPAALKENYSNLLRDREDGYFESDEEFHQAAVDTIETFYPTLRQSAEFYRRECLHCHGNSGGGDGPTARFLSPTPRDYRKGIFKFTALSDKATPRREDLFRILTDGVYTTAMPSFRRFSDAELNGAADYVRLLAMRGQVETLLTYSFLDNEAITPAAVTEAYLDTWEKWTGSDEYFIAFDGEIPAPTPASLARGRELFMDAGTGNCFSCHGEQGLGNGASAFEAGEDGEMRRIRDDWGHDIIPRDLTRGIFRFGRRPIDIYRRIYAGINGTPMPGLGTATDANGDPLLSDDEMWALVHYVRSLGEVHDGFGLNAHSVVEAGHGAGHSAGDGHGDAHGEPHEDDHGEHGDVHGALTRPEGAEAH